MTQLVDGSDTWQYAYDYEGMLAAVTLNNATVQTNTYDRHGMRVSQATTVTTDYVYEGADVVYQENLHTGAINKYAFANGLLVSEQCECGYT
jgi:YD repeat-containing protein